MRPSFLSWQRPLAGLVLLAVAWALSSRLGLPTQPPADDKVKPMDMTKVELHRLKNEELLAQANGIYQRASVDFLAAVRGLAAVQLQLEAPDPPKETPPEKKAPAPSPPDLPAEGKARAAVETAKGKQETAKQQLRSLQARKGLLERMAAALDAAQSAGVAFLNALEDLKPYAVEIALRVKDGTLAAAKAPPELSPEALERRRKDLLGDQEKQKQSVEGVRSQQSALARQIEEANRTVLAAEAEVVQAGKTLAREQKRLEMEKAHAHQNADARLADLTRMVEEGDGLKGTYELALRRFSVHAAEVGRLRKALDDLKQPEIKVPQITRPEDIEAAAQAIGKLIGYYSNRVKAIETLRAALAALVKQGGEFEADAAVSSEHLFKMQVVAGLIEKSGVAKERFPDGGQPGRLTDAAERQAKSAAEVQAATEKGKTELTALDRQLADSRQAADLASKELANLKQSQSVTTVALKWEARLRGMKAPAVGELFVATRKELAAALEKLAAEETAAKQAATAVAEIRAKRDGLKDTLLLRAEEQGQAELQKVLGELRKEAGLDRPMREAPPMPTAPPVDPKKPEPERKPGPDAKPPPPDTRSELEKLAATLTPLQQLLASRVRVLEEREERTRDLLAALDALEKKTTARNATLAEARRLALQVTAAASDLKKRVGKGELSGDQVPEGVTEALRTELRTRLDADEAGTLATLAQVEQEREVLRRPDPDADALKTAVRELLSLVGQRLDLLADLKKLMADYALARKDRPPTEVKRLDQLAAERRADEGSAADLFLGIDSSTSTKTIEELLEAYYQELTEIEDRDGNLKTQKEKIERFLELSRKESEAATLALPLLAKEGGRLQVALDEEFVLARARLRAEEADELLKAFQAKTGRLLPRPVAVADREKPEKVGEMAHALFQQMMRLDAIRKWHELLTARLAPAGIKAEAGTCQEEMARVNATLATNARRVTILTGSPASENGSADGGEIGKARRELREARIEGVKAIGIRIAIIVLAALILPRVFMWLFRRAVGGGDTGLVLTALRAFVKAAVWVTAFALILHALGIDVTAILAGLGIGGLAIGLAAQPMIADVIAALVILAEGKFRIGDVIKLGDAEPARVIGLSWRSTQLRNVDGVTIHTPNRLVTEQVVQNLTRAGQTWDGLDVTVTTEREVSKVLAVIREALEQGNGLTADHEVAVREFTQKGDTKVVRYRFSWLVRDYDGRNKARDQLFTRVSDGLAHEDLKGTEVTLA